MKTFKNLKIPIVLILAFISNPVFSQETILNKNVEHIFNSDKSQVRYKSKNNGAYLSGHKKILHQNGAISELNFTDGYPEGKWKMVDSLGVKIFIADYKKGRKHGHDIYYYDNGKMRLKAKFLNGYQDGKTLMYYPTGELGGEFYCVKGKKHGVERWFDNSDFKVIFKAYYLNNVKVDSIKFYKEYKGPVINFEEKF